MVKVKYNGKEINLASKLEKGEEELDILINDKNAEDTIEIPNEYLEDTLDLSKMSNELNKLEMGKNNE